jgi:hypothetical protein
MSEEIDSPLLGKSRVPSGEEETWIINFVNECPVAVFQALNNRLNERRLCIAISSLNPQRFELQVRAMALFLEDFAIYYEGDRVGVKCENSWEIYVSHAEDLLRTLSQVK